MGGIGTAVEPLGERAGHRGIGTQTVGPRRGGIVEVRLHVADALAGAEGFIDAVVRQHDAYSALRHPQLARIVAVERGLTGPRPGLEVVSAHPGGDSLERLIERQSQAGTPLGTAAALFIVRELLALLRVLHAHRPGSFHGALTLDAIVVTPDQRLIVRDHLFGRALATVALPSTSWWQHHGLAVPTTSGIPPFTPLTDQLQLGIVALSAVLGRSLGPSEDLASLGALLDGATERSIDGQEQPLGSALKSWLSRTLLVAPEGPFRSLNAASDALDELLDAEAGYVAAPIGLDVEDAPADAAVRVVPLVAPSYDPLVASVEPPAATADVRPDPFAGHMFIIESNDGQSSALGGRAATYEPLAVTPTVAAPPPAASSVYALPHEGTTVETHADQGRDAHPDPVAVVPTPAAAEAPPMHAAAPASEAPRPFWDLPSLAGEHVSMALPNVVVDAPPPTLGVVTPVVTTQVSTKASSLLRAAVEEFEQPIARPPFPPPPVAPTGQPIHDEPRPEPAPAFAQDATGSSRTATGPHTIPDVSPTPMPMLRRGSTLGLADDDAAVPQSRRSRLMIVAVVLAIVMGGALAGYLYLWPRGTEAAVVGEPGSLRLESKPAGAVVRVNGVEQGQTPITLPVSPGAYRIEFERGDEVRMLSAAVTSNNETYQVVTLYPPGPPGEIAVTSMPNGASVSVNGQPRGRTPLRLDGLPPGEYTVVVENSVARAEKNVEVMPDQVADVNIPLSGMLEVSSPIPVHISDRDRPLGQLRSGRLAVGAGTRRLRLTNAELGFEEVREVDVEAGGVTRLVITPPSGVLNITADTETEVYLDGRPIGLTPLTNLSVGLGMHEVAFRHARWGEQNYTVLVGLTTPSRLHVTMTVKAPKIQPRRPPTPVRRPY